MQKGKLLHEAVHPHYYYIPCRSGMVCNSVLSSQSGVVGTACWKMSYGLLSHSSPGFSECILLNLRGLSMHPTNEYRMPLVSRDEPFYRSGTAIVILQYHYIEGTSHPVLLRLAHYSTRCIWTLSQSLHRHLDLALLKEQ